MSLFLGTTCKTITHYPISLPSYSFFISRIRSSQVIQRTTANGQELKSSTLTKLPILPKEVFQKRDSFLTKNLHYLEKAFQNAFRKAPRGVDLTRETIGIVVVGKEPAVRRTRLRLVPDLSVDFFDQVACGPWPSCPRQRSWIDDWCYSDSPEEIVQKLEYSLDARQSVDRNANLGILVDAWTAKLERAWLTTTASSLPELPDFTKIVFWCKKFRFSVNHFSDRFCRSFLQAVPSCHWYLGCHSGPRVVPWLRIDRYVTEASFSYFRDVVLAGFLSRCCFWTNQHPNNNPYFDFLVSQRI